MTAIFHKRERTTEIIIHDSHTLPGQHDSIRVLRWQGRKMGLYDIGYHFVIDRNGETIEARPVALVGSALPGRDRTAVQICLIGGRDEAGEPVDNFTTAQRVSLFALIKELKGFYGPIPTLGHTEATRGRDNSEHHHEDVGFKCPPMDMGDLRSDYLTWVQTGGALA